MFELPYLTIFLSILTIGSTLPRQDLKKNSIVSRSRRMLNGTNVSIEEIASQVGLLYERNDIRRYGGAGSIISDYWVVTAAHCTCRTGPEDDIMQYVSSGSDKYDGGDIRAITEIRCHPDYGFNRTLQVTYNDIALVRVKDPFRFDRNSRPIRLFTRFATSESSAMAYGWGSNKKNGIGVSTVLQKITVEITSVNICQNFLRFVYRDTNTRPDQLCATGLSGSYICYGDSGGSLVQNGQLLGLVSWIYSDKCGNPLYPGVFVDIRVFTDWIIRTIKDSSSGILF